MPAADERPDVIPSTVDAAYECVRVDRQTPSGELADPPAATGAPAPDGADGSATTSAPAPADGAGGGGRPLCPEGYVPRRRREDRVLDGKQVVTDKPPQRNPADPDR
jgi:hypothetical protein